MESPFLYILSISPIKPFELEQLAVISLLRVANYFNSYLILPFITKRAIASAMKISITIIEKYPYYILLNFVQSTRKVMQKFLDSLAIHPIADVTIKNTPVMIKPMKVILFAPNIYKNSLVYS
jgi:hypothetical protein